MFGLFKKRDPLETLRMKYAKLSEEAMQLQRNGDIRAAAAKTSEAEALVPEMERLEAEQQS